MSEHDPHCPQSAPPSMTTALCFCALIAKVREDERSGWEPWNNEVSYDAGYSAGRAAALAEVVTYLRDPHQMPSVEAQAWANGFAEVIETGAYNGAARGES